MDVIKDKAAYRLEFRVRLECVQEDGQGVASHELPSFRGMPPEHRRYFISVEADDLQASVERATQIATEYVWILNFMMPPEPRLPQGCKLQYALEWVEPRGIVGVE